MKEEWKLRALLADQDPDAIEYDNNNCGELFIP